jgi:hypothetical protein
MPRARTFIAVVFAFALASPALGWNIPSHMVTGALTYHILESQNPQTISAVQAILEKHPWYPDRWRPDLESLLENQRAEMLFMLAARWADDIRTRDKTQHRGPWHYIHWPFRPERESVETRPPEKVNILTAIAENQRIVRQTVEPDKRAIAVAWLFHLLGDLHQPLHTVQLFTRAYPNGDRGGNDVCVRVAPGRAAIDLYRLWDGLIMSTNNIRQLSKIATDLLAKFSRVGMRELDSTTPEAWAKESYEIATKIAYEGGTPRGTPKGSALDCREVRDADFLSRGYLARAKLISERRVYLASMRLANLLQSRWLSVHPLQQGEPAK